MLTPLKILDTSLKAKLKDVELKRQIMDLLTIS